MGFPVTAGSVELVGRCCFSRDLAPPAQRTPVSQRQQSGNTMHVNCVGAVSYTHLTLPTICSV
eukprot:15436568-Alexandrium_andersonii.AAC.1